ncbi:MAG: hypothetical protein ABI680_13575 [Chthoniobacteraceae bacterium]
MKNTLIFFLTTLPIIAADSLPSGSGLAAQYPGDVGLERDPRVVQVENFEEADVATLAGQWEAVMAQGDMSFTADVPPGSAGRQSLLMDRQSGSGGSLYRRLKNAAGGFGYDRIFARYYVKFAEDCAELHHFGTCIGGNLPATPWPSVKAGIRNNGAKSFWSGIEPFGKAWTWDFYTYWCEMRGSPPRGQTWGNSFIHDPKLAVERGRWICVEQMIHMNDVGDTNGEQALWLDGKLIAHLGKGFPRGRWTFDKFEPGLGGGGVRWNDTLDDREYFDVADGGAPFEGYRWRTARGLNVNFVWLYVYATKEGRARVNFDDVVVATEYVGPLAAKK